MGATRLALTMGVVGLAGGAVLAMATVPSLRSYQDGESRPIVEYEREIRAADDAWRIAAGPRDGTIVLGVPSWAESAAEWLAVGQRAMATWRIWFAPDERDLELERSGSWETRLAERREQARYADREERSRDELPARPVADDAGADPLARIVDDAAAEAAANALDAAQDVLAIEIEQ